MKIRSGAVLGADVSVAVREASVGRRAPARSTRRAAAFSASALLAAAVSVLAIAPGRALAVSPVAGMAAPDFTVRTLGGDHVSLHDYRGRVVLVLFWSSWCSRCGEEMAYIRAMEEKYPELEVLALNAETDKPTAADVARIEAAAQRWEKPRPVAIDDGLAVWSRYQVNALPTTMIVGPDGRIVFIEANFYWASPELIDNALRAAFGNRSGEPVEAVLDGQGQTFRPESGEGDLLAEMEGIRAAACRKALCLLADLPRP